MENLKLYSDKSCETLFTFENNSGIWHYQLTNEGIECVDNNGLIGDRTYWCSILDDVIFTVSEGLKAFTESKEIDFSLYVDEDFNKETINQGISHLDGVIEPLLVSIYGATQNYNTDIIIERNGTVRTHNYFGSLSYRDEDIAFVYTIAPQMIDSYLSMLQEGLTETQLNYCIENGWTSIWETNSDNPEDWDRFEVGDNMDDFRGEFKKIVEMYNENSIEF